MTPPSYTLYWLCKGVYNWLKRRVLSNLPIQLPHTAIVVIAITWCLVTGSEIIVAGVTPIS